MKKYLKKKVNSSSIKGKNEKRSQIKKKDVKSKNEVEPT